MVMTLLPARAGSRGPRAGRTLAGRTLAGRILGAVALAVAIGGLSACSGGDEGGSQGESEEAAADDFTAGTAKEIAEAAVRDTTAVSSLTMSGDITTGGQEIGIDLSLNTDGQCRGTIGVGGGEAEIISLEDTAFLRGDEAFWAASAGGEAAAQAITRAVGEKWIRLPEDQNQFGDFCDLDGLLDEFEEVGSGEEAPEKGEVTDVNGVEAIALIDTNADGDQTTGWVAVDEPHHLVRIEVGGDEAGTIDLGGFDEPLDLTEPDAADVVDFSTIIGSGGAGG